MVRRAGRLADRPSAVVGAWPGKSRTRVCWHSPLAVAETYFNRRTGQTRVLVVCRPARWFVKLGLWVGAIEKVAVWSANICGDSVAGIFRRIGKLGFRAV